MLTLAYGRAGCRLHGAGCRTPWGYDEAHTDQREPYTLDHLADRVDPPHRYAYPTARDYEQGFYLWRALRRDRELNHAERAVHWNGQIDRMVTRGMDPAEAEQFREPAD